MCATHDQTETECTDKSEQTNKQTPNQAERRKIRYRKELKQLQQQQKLMEQMRVAAAAAAVVAAAAAAEEEEPVKEDEKED